MITEEMSEKASTDLSRIFKYKLLASVNKKKMQTSLGGFCFNAIYFSIEKVYVQKVRFSIGRTIMHSVSLGASQAPRDPADITALAYIIMATVSTNPN